jgi:GxxExxY protein
MLRGLRFEREVSVALRYKCLALDQAYRVDLVVEAAVIVEVKAIAAIEAVHTAQLLTYLKLTRRRLGLLIDFNVPRLVDGVRRVVNGY